MNNPPVLPDASLSQVCAKVGKDLERAGISNAVDEARRLISEAAGIAREDFILSPNRELGGAQLEAVSQWLQRRRSGEPLGRIRGWQEFYGRKFMLSEATLEPRADTEILIEVALELIDVRQGRSHPWHLVDVGTGTGCLAITLLAELPHATAVGTDISAQAIDTARANAEAHGVGDRARWQMANFLEGVAGPFNLLISNPPYIKYNEIAGLSVEVRDHDPAVALNGGQDGLDAYRAIAAMSLGRLSKGLMILETACSDEARVLDTVHESTCAEDLHCLGVWRDLNGCGRCVALEILS